MKTSCFNKYTGDMGVAVCLYPPIDWAGLRFPALAPTSNMFQEIKSGKINKIEYEHRYREEVLGKLDAGYIYIMLKNNVLLCWEPPGEFCHRRIIASWIKEELGYDVPEWNLKDDAVIKNKNPLF
jgi:hypothetical protein